jgi:hypothetical protein
MAPMVGSLVAICVGRPACYPQRRDWLALHERADDRGPHVGWFLLNERMILLPANLMAPVVRHSHAGIAAR